MIEITHQQAERLIRNGLDAAGSRISQEQWSALQAHLESCPQCRAYAQQHQTLEKDVAHSLHGRWGGVAGPPAGVFRAVVDQREAARARWERQRRALVGLGAAAALALTLIARRAFTSSPPEATPTLSQTAQAAPAPTPTPLGTFRGLLAFESAHEGNAEIYLLNAGPGGNDLTNLTQSPAQDRDPQWSPDGEWVAFLSDRSGQNEVYVMHVAGSRLTRLTADPGLDWRGPLSWSVDGQWIAARALRREQGGEAYLYLVPLDGSAGLRSVAFSRGAPGNGLFSPNFTTLAFQSGTPPGRLMVYGLQTGWTSAVNYRDMLDSGLRSAGGYDWAVGGVSLLYLAEGPYGAGQAPQLLPDARSELHLSPIQSESTVSALLNTSPWMIASAGGLGALRAPVWVPDSLAAAALQEAGGAERCWALNLYPNSPAAGRVVELKGLCLEGGLTRQSWQALNADETWMVARGRRPGQSGAGFFAVRLPLRFALDPPDSILPRVEGLGAPGLAFPTDPADWPGEPRVRPGGARLRIRPQAAAAVPAVPAAARPGPQVSGRLAVTRLSGAGSALAALTPGGGNALALVGEESAPGCPALSPDGARLAYLSLAENPARGNEVWIIDLPGGAARRAAGFAALPGAGEVLPRYGCPVWAPDGTRLAAEYRSGGLTYLALIPTAGASTVVDYLRIEALPVPPQWAAAQDGANGPPVNGPLLLVYPRRLSSPLHVVSLDPQSDENRAALLDHAPAVTADLAVFPGAESAGAFAAAPDGSRIALVTLTFESGTQLVRQARLLAGDPRSLAAVDLSGYDPNRAGPRTLAFLAGGQVGLLQPLPLSGSVKSIVARFDPASGRLESVAQLTDLTSAAAWTPGGEWVFLASESGLWALDVEGALSGEAAPARLLADWVTDVDYRGAAHD